MRAERRIEIWTLSRQSRGRLREPGRSGKRRRRGVEPVQAEVGPQRGEGIERDSAERRQLSAGNAEHPVAAAQEDGLAAEADRCAAGARKHPEPGRRRSDPPAGDCVRLERDGGLSEDLRDLRLGDVRVVGAALVDRVRRPEQEQALPRDGERDADLVVWDHEGGAPRLLGLDEDVDALAEPPGARRPRVLEAANAVDPGAGRVDDGAGAHARPAVADAILDLRAGDAGGRDPKSGYLHVVRDDRARFRRPGHRREAEAAVVRPRVGVRPAGMQAVGPERGNASPRAVGRDEPAEPLAGERRVEPQAGLDRARPVGPAVVEREEERKPPHEVGSDDLDERAPLAVGLADEADVAEAEVAKAAVDELRRGARGLRAEVGAVDERDREPGPRCLPGYAGADDPAAYHEQVETPPAELLERFGAAQLSHSGFVHAVRPAASRTSTRPYGVNAGRSRRAAVTSPRSSASRTSLRIE
jgi:hypothetical protein